MPLRVPQKPENLVLTSRATPTCFPVSTQNLENLFLTSRVPPNMEKMFFTDPRGDGDDGDDGDGGVTCDRQIPRFARTSNIISHLLHLGNDANLVNGIWPLSANARPKRPNENMFENKLDRFH